MKERRNITMDDADKSVYLPSTTYKTKFPTHCNIQELLEIPALVLFLYRIKFDINISHT